MSASASHLFTGKWRIIEADIWDKEFLDLIEQAYIQFDDNGYGEFVVGAVTGSIDCAYSTLTASFNWAGNDEMDEASGSGEAKIKEEGSLIIDLKFFRGDEVELKAVKK